MPFSVGARIGPYELRAPFGKGGMGSDASGGDAASYRIDRRGRSFQKVLSKDENTGGSDLEFDPTNLEVKWWRIALVTLSSRAPDCWSLAS